MAGHLIWGQDRAGSNPAIRTSAERAYIALSAHYRKAGPMDAVTATILIRIDGPSGPATYKVATAELFDDFRTAIPELLRSIADAADTVA